MAAYLLPHTHPFMNDTEAFALLASLPGLGPTKIRLLIERFGSAQHALNATPAQISALPGFDRIAQSWSKREDSQGWKQDLALADKLGATLLPFTHPDFPKQLLEIPDPPVLLYVQGKIKPQDHRSIAIVGTRHASIYGMEMAESISKDLAANGFTVVSGLARGIDTAAHRGAVAVGRTIAVIGSGLADIYPPDNRDLARVIAERGALLSEFSMATPPDRQNFPQRNRIVSGFTLGTVLIEAPVKSGAMITMDRAKLHRKKLFALPGRADAESFKGNHLLIKGGQAHLIENAADIMAHFDCLFTVKQPSLFDGNYPRLDKEESALLEQMPSDEVGIDALSALLHLPIHHVHTTLMGLVLKKIVKEYPGKIYKKVNNK